MCSSDLADRPVALLKSPKSRLQERTQRDAGARPGYRLVEVRGPDHARTFRVEVVVGERILGAGSGGSRRDAENAAIEVRIAKKRKSVYFWVEF